MSVRRKSRREAQGRRVAKSRLRLEGLEPRLLLYHGPTLLPDGSVEVELDETFDQFGFQAAMFQAYEDQVDFSIFDTGASVVTFSATSQFFFQFFGSTGIPIKVPCGAAAEGVGGTLTGHVSEPGTIQADGLHVANLTFDAFGFPVFELMFDPATAAIVPGVQAFVGALIGDVAEGGCPLPASEELPTITGTPMLNPTLDNPNGLAVNIRPLGELLDFSDFPELNGLVLPVPDVRFQQPGLGVPDDPTCTQQNQDGTTRDICTDPVRVAMDFVGLDNHLNPGNSITESYNPVQNQVEVQNDATVLQDQVYLFDTGAQLSIISTEVAEAFGLDLDNPQTTISVQGAAGAVHDIPGFTIDRISIPLATGGNLTFSNVPIYVLDVAPGVLDGILGMNLFNNAAAMVYDPFHPAGPSLELTFFTEHLYGLFGSAVPESEPNNTASLATALGAGQYGVGSIAPAGDTDFWVRKDVNPGDLVFAYVDTQSSTTSTNSTLTVLADDGTPIEFDDNDGPGLSSVVAGAPVPQLGRVFFQVNEAGGGTISQYELYQEVVSPGDSAGETEGNNTTLDANPIKRTITTGSVAPGSGDVDFFSFVATTGSRIVVIMDNDPDGNSQTTHTVLSILDPDGNPLKLGDNSSGTDGNAAGAIVSAPTSGVYYIKVADGGAGADDDYRFVVQVLDGGDPLAGAVLMFNVLTAQAEAEATVDNCLTDILACDLSALLGSLDFLLSVTPVLAFAGSIGAGLLPVGFDNNSMTSSVQVFEEATDLLFNCLLDPNCDFDQLFQQLDALISQDLTPGSVQMINGGRLPAFDLADTIAPDVTLDAPDLTNDPTPTVTVQAQDGSGLQNGTPVALDVDLTGDGDFDDAGEKNYRSANLFNGTAQFDVTPALPEGTRRLRSRVSDAAGNEGTSSTQIVVVDLTAPTLADMPADQTVEMTSAAGAVVTYSPPTASDNLDPDPLVSCAPQSGSTFPLGTTTVTCTATDDAGNSRSATFKVTVYDPSPDTTPPVLQNMPANMTVEATSAAGAAATYTPPTATDNVDPDPTVNCLPASGLTFPIATTTVTCTATDDAGNFSSAMFTVTVRDTTAPTLTNMPTNRTVEATSAAGAVVTFSLPTATDLVDSDPTVDCTPASGSTFSLGITTVTCTATDDAANSSSAMFTITVQDTTAPTLTNMPANRTVEATRAAGAVVLFSLPTATDLVDPTPTVQCTPVSGSTFSLGSTTVICTATDDAANSSSATFTITVRDTIAPTLTNMPVNRTVEATSAAGAVETFSLPTATDLVDSTPTVNCSPISGSTFSLGSATVTCTATDDAGNSRSATFTVTVRDTTSPTLTVPSDIAVEATGPAGAVVSYSATATDLVDGSVSVSCLPASGNTFPISTTTVNCSSSDSRGNLASGNFKVTVRDTSPPTLTLPENITVEATGPAGAVVNYNATASDAVDGSVSVSCSLTSGSPFPITTTTVNCSASDSRGNAAMDSFEVTVRDTTRPVIAPHDDVTIETTEPAGAVVNYTSPTTSDAVDGAGVAICLPASGSTFPMVGTTVDCNATDAAGNKATPTTFTITVTPTPPRIEFSGGLLTILGTIQDDTIRLLKSGRGFLVQTNFGNLTIPTRRSLTSVVVQARGGSDFINLALLSSAQNAQLDGGSGDDSITAGGGNDVLLGGLGADQLTGNQGDNLLVGGGGSDRLLGSRGSDILIGGTLDESAGPIDLSATLAAWRAVRTPTAKRVAVQQLIDHLLDDIDADILTGGSGTDLFDAGLIDQITDRKPADLLP